MTTNPSAEGNACGYLQAKAEVGMAMELWWRGAALEAFKALLLSPLVSTPGPESEKLQRRLAAILQPTLAVILASPVLQVPPPPPLPDPFQSYKSTV